MTAIGSRLRAEITAAEAVQVRIQRGAAVRLVGGAVFSGSYGCLTGRFACSLPDREPRLVHECQRQAHPYHHRHQEHDDPDVPGSIHARTRARS
jgi:hypothetical protein